MSNNQLDTTRSTAVREAPPIHLGIAPGYGRRSTLAVCDQPLPASDPRYPFWYAPTCPACQVAEPDKCKPVDFFDLKDRYQLLELFVAAWWLLRWRWTQPARAVRAAGHGRPRLPRPPARLAASFAAGAAALLVLLGARHQSIATDGAAGHVLGVMATVAALAVARPHQPAWARHVGAFLLPATLLMTAWPIHLGFWI